MGMGGNQLRSGYSRWLTLTAAAGSLTVLAALTGCSSDKAGPPSTTVSQPADTNKEGSKPIEPVAAEVDNSLTPEQLEQAEKLANDLERSAIDYNIYGGLNPDINMIIDNAVEVWDSALTEKNPKESARRLAEIGVSKEWFEFAIENTQNVDYESLNAQFSAQNPENPRVIIDPAKLKEILEANGTYAELPQSVGEWPDTPSWYQGEDYVLSMSTWADGIGLPRYYVGDSNYNYREALDVIESEASVTFN